MRSARGKNRNQFSSFMKLARRQPEIRIRLIIPGCRHPRKVGGNSGVAEGNLRIKKGRAGGGRASRWASPKSKSPGVISPGL
jgi:hypothetical protein